MDNFETELMNDLMAEGPSARQTEAYADDGFEDDYEAGGDAYEEDAFLGNLIGTIGRAAGNLLGGGAGFEEDGFEEDGFEADAYGDGFEDSFEEGAESFEDAMADALEEEDNEAFFRRLRSIASRVGRGVGRVARVVAPIASAIPLPWTQAIGAAANIAGRVLADGADEFEAIDELVDFLDEESLDAALPLVAGLAIRRALPGAARMARPARRQMVRQVTQAMRGAVRRQRQPGGARVAARAVRAAARAVQQRRISPRQIGATVQRVTQAVVKRPAQAQRLARPLTAPARRVTPAGRVATAVLRRVPLAGGNVLRGTCARCGPRRIVLRGPVTIHIAR